MKENWKDIKGYEGAYQVSTMGQVRSLDRSLVIKSRKGNDYHYKMRGRILKQAITNAGYLTVELNLQGKKPKRLTTHRLVALSFIPNTENKSSVNHIDFNKLNNIIENLEWVTHSENMKHCFDNNRHPGSGLKGSQMHTSKINEKQAKEIREQKGSISGLELAKKYGVSHTIIYGIWNDKIWKHV